MCVAHVLLCRPNPWFLRRIAVILRQSLCDPFQMAFFLLWISYLGLYLWAPSCPSVVCGEVVVHVWCALQRSSLRDWYKWFSLHRCARNDLGARYLLRKNQPRIQQPVRLPGPQGTWDPISAEHSGVQPRNRGCNPDLNPTFNVWNGLINFCSHEFTQSGEYNMGLPVHHPINQE